MTVNTGGEKESSLKKISFNSRVTVVLIPERKEIKAAGCDLWWNRNDYTSFQQSAQSEIRLYAMYENINCKEAKSMLYQPSESDLTKDEPEEIEDGWDMTLAVPSEDGASLDEKEDFFSPKMLRHVDSVSLLIDHESAANKAAPLSPVRSTSRLSLPMKPKPSEDDLHVHISLCVPSTDFEPLAEKDSAGRKRSSQRIDQSSGFAVVCGIFSFTLPIIGYYLMHYSN